MYSSSHALRTPRRVSPPALRGAAAVIAVSGLALLAAACGGSNKVASVSSSSQRDGPQHDVAPAQRAQLGSEYSRFARCMRSHGVGDFPDPITGSGGHPGFRLQGGSTSDLNSSDPAFQRGVEACQHILGHQFRFAFTSSGGGKGA
jgi:hypothetical protein